jgi:hypothetical protein
MGVFGDIGDKKIPQKYICNLCNYSCSRLRDWTIHISRPKHQNNVNGDEKIHNFQCQCCNKIYKSRNGLWKHTKKCNINNNPDNEQLIYLLIKQNSQLIKDTNEFKNMLVEQNNIILEQQSKMIEVCKHETYIHTNNIINNSFNLQFFLNETCKDAMNISDFIHSIKLQLSDLETVGKIGFVNGISKIIIQNLNALDETKRPVHCTDKKREIIYVKDDNKWEKEDADYIKIRQAIKILAKRNSKLLFDFKDKYPECMNSDSKYSDKYTKLFIEAYGGSGKEDVDNENKIIKNISKTILIVK